MENLLLDAFVEVIGDGSHEHTLRECGDFTGRDQAVELGGYGCAFVVPVDGHRLAFLQNLSEAFGKHFGGIAYYLTGEYIADRVHYHSGFFISVVAFKLRKVLKTE